MELVEKTIGSSAGQETFDVSFTGWQAEFALSTCETHSAFT